MFLLGLAAFSIIVGCVTTGVLAWLDNRKRKVDDQPHFFDSESQQWGPKF